MVGSEDSLSTFYFFKTFQGLWEQSLAWGARGLWPGSWTAAGTLERGSALLL